MPLTIDHWKIIAAILVAVLGIVGQWFIARRNLRQTTDLSNKTRTQAESLAQRTLDHAARQSRLNLEQSARQFSDSNDLTSKLSQNTLDLQNLVSHRSAASFIADKRQKWIDELRTDMAFHLALSQEIIWKWDAWRTRTDTIKQSMSEVQKLADAFSLENGPRDREHQERHIRIKFRLNPSEPLHIELRHCLDSVRDVLSKTQGAADRQFAWDLIHELKGLISVATQKTEEILKQEWFKVKQEVAYPGALMAKIPDPSKPDVS